MQVEVSGGRGRPSTIVDKDEGLGKVNIYTSDSTLQSMNTQIYYVFPWAKYPWKLLIIAITVILTVLYMHYTSILITNYSYFSGQFDAAKLRKLRPSFKETGGTVTAGNASSIRSHTFPFVLFN